MEELWINLIISIVWTIILYFWNVKKEGVSLAARHAIFVGFFVFIVMMIISIWKLVGVIVLGIIVIGLFVFVK